MTSFRRALPNVNTAGREKAAVLNHCLAVLGPALGSPVTLGRSGLFPLTRPIFATSFEAPRFTVNGAPLCAVRIPPARHPAAAARTQPLVPRAKGRLYTKLPTNRFRWSKLESAFSTARSCA